MGSNPGVSSHLPVIWGEWSIMPINCLLGDKLAARTKLSHNPYHHTHFGPRDDDGDHLFVIVLVRD